MTLFCVKSSLGKSNPIVTQLKDQSVEFNLEQHNYEKSEQILFELLSSVPDSDQSRRQQLIKKIIYCLTKQGKYLESIGFCGEYISISKAIGRKQTINKEISENFLR